MTYEQNSPDRFVEVIASLPEIPGIRYQTWSAADTFVQTQAPTSSNIWGILIPGQNAENGVLRAWIHIIGVENQTVLSGAWTCDAPWTVDPYERVIENCIITGTLSPAGTVLGVSLEQITCFDCVLKGGTANAGVTGRIDTFVGSVQGGNWSNLVSFSAISSFVQAGPGLAIIFGSIGLVTFDNAVLITGVPGSVCTFNGGVFTNCNISLATAQFVFNTGSYGIYGGSLRASLSTGTQSITLRNVSTPGAPTPTITINDGGSGTADNVSSIFFVVDADGGSGGGTLTTSGITGSVTNNGTWTNNGVAYDPNKLALNKAIDTNTQDAIDSLQDGFTNSLATLNTTDNTSSILDTIATSTDSELYISATVLGRRTGGVAGANGDAGAYERKARIKNVGGVVTIHDPESEYTSEDQVGWSCFFDTSGTDIVVRVIGATDNNITWNSSTKAKVNG